MSDELFIKLRQVQDYDFDYNVPLLYINTDALLCHVDSPSINEPDIVYIYYVNSSEERKLFQANVENLYVITAIRDDNEITYVKPSQWVDLYNMNLFNQFVKYSFKKAKYNNYLNYVVSVDDLNNYDYSEVFNNRGKNFQQNLKQLQQEIYQIENKYDTKLTTLDTIYHAFMNGINSANGLKLTDEIKEQLWRQYRPQYIESDIDKYYNTKIKILLNSALKKLIVNPSTI